MKSEDETEYQALTDSLRSHCLHIEAILKKMSKANKKYEQSLMEDDKMSEQINFQDFDVLEGMLTHGWHPMLIEIFIWIIKQYRKITLNSAYRSHKIHAKDSGIHITIPLRAIDLDSTGFKFPELVEDKINRKFEYDPDRPRMRVAIYHDVGLGPHLHIQVHDNTVYR